MYLYIVYTYVPICYYTHYQEFLLQVGGVPFVINGRVCHFRGTVSVVSADNLASASLGGFKQSGSAFRFCRHCMGTEDDIQSK